MISKITLKKNNGIDEIVVDENNKTTILKRDLNGDFASQRNHALLKAKGDWIFFIDSDEKINRALENEIENPPPGFDAFLVKRIDYFWGRLLKHGETGNIKLLRFAKKNFGQWRGKVHEVWVGKGKIGKLQNPLEHYPHPTIREFIEKINFYTTLRANELHDQGVKFNALEAVIKPLGKFLENYFLKFGFLDGQPGFIYALMMSFHSLIVRLKLYDFSRNS